MGIGSPAGPGTLSDDDVRLVAESLPHIVWAADADGATRHLNGAGAKFVGVGPDDDGRWQWGPLIHPDDRDQGLREWRRAVDTGTPFRAELRLRRHDGLYRWHEFRSGPVRDAAGNVVRWVGTATDVEDRRCFEQQVLESERSAAQALTLFETLLASSPVGFAFVDREFRVVHANEMLAAASGCPLGDMIGRTVAEVVPMLWQHLEPLLRSVVERGEPRLNVDVSPGAFGMAGPIRHALGSYYPVRLGDDIIGVGCVVADITDRVDAHEKRVELLRAAVGAIAATIDARDPYTAGHQHRVADIAAAIATEMALVPDEVEGIRLAATLHDIGKIGVPSEILTRASSLRPAEWALLKTHPRTGSEIVAGIDFPWPVADMIVQHHERLDGSGYPEGLRGDEVCTGARVIAVADTVEAMAANRPYRTARGLQAALDELEEGAGSRYDAAVVEACLQLCREGRLPLHRTAGGG